MDYLLLDTFLTIIREGSFSKAAKAMNCVQSNITARVKRLEAHFGQVLFERGRNGAQITHFGRQLQQQAQTLLAAHQQAERELIAAAGTIARFQLGSMETTAETRLPPILKRLAEQHPQTNLSLRAAATGEITTMVWERQLDAAFVAGPVDEQRFHSIPAFDETLVVARPQKYKGALPMLGFRSACTYRMLATQWLRSQGRSDTVILEMGTLGGMLGCVEAGMGFAVFPQSTLKNYRHFADIVLEPLPAEFAEVTTFLIWRNDLRVNPVHQSLMDML